MVAVDSPAAVPVEAEEAPGNIIKKEVKMGEEIFRKKSLDMAKSPDNLDDYIRVSNPSVWLLLISVIVLLIGAVVWGVFGYVDSTVPSLVSVQNEQAVCYVAEEDITSVNDGMIVKYDDCEAVINKIGEKSDQGYECLLDADSYPVDGLYDGKIVTKSYHPISFVLN